MTKSKLIMGINKQYSIESLYCIGDIKNEEQLEKLKSESYLVDYTKESWEQEYPSIPAEHIYCVKCEVIPMGLYYMDMDHGILIRTHIYSKDKKLMVVDKMDVETVLNRLIEEKMEYYTSKKYLKLFLSELSEQSGKIVLAMFSHLLENEEPCEELYKDFFSIYTHVDSGCEQLSQKARKNLLVCKSEKQKEKTKAALAEFGERVRVYRGQGKLSTPEKYAMSWTTNKNVALFFATRFEPEQAVLLEGTVLKEDILEYNLERGECEAIVFPDSVTVTSRQNMMDLDEFVSYSWGIQNYVSGRKNEKSYKKQYHFNKLIKRVLHLYEKYGDTNDHGEKHTSNVTLLANALYAMNSECQNFYSDEQIYQNFKHVMDAAIYHDIGRTHGFDDPDHGKKSYQIYKKENGENSVVKFLIENHCVGDEEARKNLEQSFQEKDRERVFELLGILKDADALDRMRFGFGSRDYIRTEYLHENDAIRLGGIANWMQEQNMEVWR